MKSDFARLIITKSGNCVHIISFLVEPPSFVRKLENLSFLVGSEVSLQCILKGSEPMTIFWMRDNHELKEAEHIQITYENNTALLHIIDLQSKHGGKYSCQAQNQAGSQTCSAVLTVKGWLKYLKTVTWKWTGCTLHPYSGAFRQFLTTHEDHL